MEARIAASRGEYFAALRLLYECYCRQGYMRPHPARICFRPHYGLNTSRTFIYVAAGGRVLGTLSAVGDNPNGLPADILFGPELKRLRQENRRLVEATGFAIAMQARPQSLRIFFELTRLLVQYCYWSHYDDIVIAVHPRQAPFYTEVLGFEAFAECRPHPYVLGAPAVGLHLDLRLAHRRLNPEVCRRYLRPRIPPRVFQVPPMSRRDFRYFLAMAGVDPENLCATWEPPQRFAA